MGWLIIENLVTVQNEAQISDERMELGSTLTVEILGGGTFDFIKGRLTHGD